MTDTTKLAPCPFCGGEAEMDTQRSYRALTSGKLGRAVAIYCLACDADMTLCWEDVPAMATDDMAALLTENWNRRASPSPDLSAENARLREVLKQAQKALAMCIEPSKITGTTVQSAFANITAAEARARQALGDAPDAEKGE